MVGQNRSAQRYVSRRLPDEDEVTGKIVKVVSQYAYYGYRLVTGMLRGMGYRINHKRVYRIWRSLGLKIPEKQPKRLRLWLDENSCIRFRAEHPNHVWSYDFVVARTSRGRKIKILNIIDEYTRECLCSHPAPRIRSEHVIEQLWEVRERMDMWSRSMERWLMSY